MYNSSTTVYFYFKNCLGKDISEPPGFFNHPELRLVDMFTACTHPEVKNVILKQFHLQDSSLRIIVATIAFGMGLDCPNVHHNDIIHWRRHQTRRRAGREGLPATAKLFSAVKDSASHTDEKIKDYNKLKLGDCHKKYISTKKNLIQLRMTLLDTNTCANVVICDLQPMWLMVYTITTTCLPTVMHCRP